jgi:hypothetical protein
VLWYSFGSTRDKATTRHEKKYFHATHFKDLVCLWYNPCQVFIVLVVSLICVLKFKLASAVPTGSQVFAIPENEILPLDVGEPDPMVTIHSQDKTSFLLSRKTALKSKLLETMMGADKDSNEFDLPSLNAQQVQWV